MKAIKSVWFTISVLWHSTVGFLGHIVQPYLYLFLQKIYIYIEFFCIKCSQNGSVHVSQILPHRFWTNHFYMDLALCMGVLSCWNSKGPSPNCCHKVGSTELSRMSLYAIVLKSSLELRGLARTMKNSPRPFFLHQTLQLALCIRSGSLLLASAKPRFVCRTARWWSVIHHSREHVSTAPESNDVKLYTTPANAWNCVWLLSHGNFQWRVSIIRTFPC
jgi:hypothetical protein